MIGFGAYFQHILELESKSLYKYVKRSYVLWSEHDLIFALSFGSYNCEVHEEAPRHYNFL
jgi:hypothetical protein